MSSSPLRERAVVRGPALVLDTLRSNAVTAAVWVVGGSAANVAMSLALKHEMDSFPGGAGALAASIMPAAEAMRPLRWPAERLDTLGGYLSYHNLTLFALFLTVYGAMQGARAIRGGEDDHSLEEILATGWSRWAVVRDRALGFVATIAIVALGLGLGTAAGLAAAHEPDLSGALAAFAAIGSCALLGYGLGLFVSQLTIDRRASAGISAVVLTCLYVVENTWEDLHGLAPVRFLSPFHYANLSRALVPGHGFDPLTGVVLLTAAALLVLASGWAFQHRDYRAPLWRRTGPVPRERTVADATTGADGVLSRVLLRSVWSALMVRGRYGLLAWSGAAALFTGLMMFLEPAVMYVWSWFASFIPGGGGLTGASAQAQYIAFAT